MTASYMLACTWHTFDHCTLYIIYYIILILWPLYLVCCIVITCSWPKCLVYVTPIFLLGVYIVRKDYNSCQVYYCYLGIHYRGFTQTICPADNSFIRHEMREKTATGRQTEIKHWNWCWIFPSPLWKKCVLFLPVLLLKAPLYSAVPTLVYESLHVGACTNQS